MPNDVISVLGTLITLITALQSLVWFVGWIRENQRNLKRLGQIICLVGIGGTIACTTIIHAEVWAWVSVIVMIAGYIFYQINRNERIADGKQSPDLLIRQRAFHLQAIDKNKDQSRFAFFFYAVMVLLLCYAPLPEPFTAVAASFIAFFLGYVYNFAREQDMLEALLEAIRHPPEATKEGS